MVSSMTAFARQDGAGDWGRGAWEVRSVNHRYLEIYLRLPDELRALETAVRERVGRSINRGKVDCSLRFSPAARSGSEFTLDMALAERLIRAARAIEDQLQEATPLSAADILRWPGVVETTAIDWERVAGPLLALLDATLSTLVESRRREGEKLGQLIAARCAEARDRIRALKACLPDIMVEIRQRLLNRVAEAGIELDSGRIEQEVVVLAAKLDVAEELDRLEAHLDEVLRVLDLDAPTGRRLDFLMQELNREANTLGAKSAHLASSAAALELKVLIEQMREQVQNIE
jgi:uncharacterized protein (TIGR00255 family)